MALPGDLVNPLLACMNAEMTWPGLGDRGLPNFALASLTGAMAPINYLLDFLPPNPSKLPSVPGIQIVIDPFMASVKLPDAYPEINVSLGGVTISIPGKGSPPYEYDLSGEMKLICVVIALPFLCIKGIIEKIISDLVVELPTAATIQGIFVALALEVGLSGAAVPQFAYCLATALFNLFTALIPV